MTRKQYKILNYIYHSPKTVGQIKSHFKYNDKEIDIIFGGEDDFFKYYYHENADNRDDSVVYINNTGSSIVESKRTDSFRFWVPIILNILLSISALIISIIALLI